MVRVVGCVAKKARILHKRILTVFVMSDAKNGTKYNHTVMPLPMPRTLRFNLMPWTVPLLMAAF